MDNDPLDVRLARCVLIMAAAGGMPDSFWLSDTRIALAADTLGLTPIEARTWAQRRDPHCPEHELGAAYQETP